VDVPEISEELPEAIEEAAPVPILDLNQAGLIDLERLPGIGFTRAQAILDYREQHGPYQEIDELLLVTGITPDMLLELKQYLTVGGTLVTAAAEPPAEDHQILLVQARNALVQGDIPLAVSRYGILIEKKEMLPDVITDLNEALYRFPIDVAIWEALGDAHLRAGHLQDALNAYTKAEEYLH
jgi:competence ComEA-like helix-hairpin-helix protein